MEWNKITRNGLSMVIAWNESLFFFFLASIPRIAAAVEMLEEKRKKKISTHVWICVKSSAATATVHWLILMGLGGQIE